MDEKTEELRDLFVDVTESETVTERQQAARGSLTTDESTIEERLRSTVETMDERYDFETDFAHADLVEIVRLFYAGSDDGEIARELGDGSLEKEVTRARIELHLVAESDRNAPIDLDALRSRLQDGQSIEEIVAAVDVDESTVRQYARLVEIEQERKLVGDRFRQEFEHVLGDRALSDRLTEGVREDGLEDATEGIETNVSF